MIEVERRYHRSVSLTLDWGRREALDGYVLSPLVQETQARILADLAMPGAPKSWSLVGPYGTGKSAFALYLATALARESATIRDRAATSELATRIHDLQTQLGRGWTPVFVLGERAPLNRVLLEAMHRTVDTIRSDRGRPPLVLTGLKDALDRLAQHGQVTSSEVLTLVEEFVTYAKLRRSGGVLFVFDELGKFLEHAAREPGQSDIFLLQQLAEKAARSEHPVGILTILHQSFSLYAEHLPRGEREEWQKVQGRFDELPFLEPSEHLVTLLSLAIRSDGRESPDLRREHEVAVDAITAAAADDQIARLRDVLVGTFPLHPAVALLLAPMFRGAFAQNERSLFAFLTSREPGGFAHFLANHAKGAEIDRLYGTDDLFDYVSSALAMRVSSRRQERLWGLVEQAMGRQHGPSAAERIRLLKALALVERFGARAGLRTTTATLALAAGLTDDTVEDALDDLRGLVVFRHHSSTYHLWDESVVDLPKVIEDGRRAAETAGNVAATLEQRIPLQAIVAGRHLHTTGTLRFLEPRLVDETAFDSSLEPRHPGNGLILYVLPRSAAGARDLIESLRDPKVRAKRLRHPATVVAVAEQAERLRDQALNLLALDHALTTSRALELDAVAKRELGIQLNEASNTLIASLGQVFGWAAGGSGPAQALWFTSKEGEQDAPARLSALASDLMDRAFHKAPEIHNELINRHELSSAAAAARRNLAEAMLNCAQLDRLGIVGHPPELAIYLSLFETTGAHDHGTAPYWFKPQGELGTVWDAIHKILRDADEAVGLGEIFGRLEKPPYGLKMGVLPLLVFALMLSERDELTVFEDGSLVPYIDSAIAERLLRRPESFALRTFATKDSHEGLLASLHRLWGLKGTPSLLGVTKALIAEFGRLPDYAKATNHLSAPARKLRTVLTMARDPHVLLFHDLPELAADEGGRTLSEPEELAKFVTALVRELGTAYSGLMERLFLKVLAAFRAGSQAELIERARCLPERGLVPAIAGFRVRAVNEAPKDEWTASLATLIIHRPPDKWRDDDEDAFALSIIETGRLFRRYERVGADWGAGPPRIMVSVLGTDGSERSDFAMIRATEATQTDAVAKAFLATAQSNGLNQDQLLVALAKVLAEIEQRSEGRNVDV